MKDTWRDTFDELSAEGKTIVFVTHEPDVAARASHLLKMRDGQVAEVDANRHDDGVDTEPVIDLDAAAQVGDTSARLDDATAEVDDV